MRNKVIPKLAAYWPEPINGPMSYNNWMEQRTAFANALIAALPGPVNTDLPFETHPYSRLQLEMPSNPKAYIIGTAPPASYLRSMVPGVAGAFEGEMSINGQSVGAAPNLNFYHGNESSFWTAIGFACGDVTEVMAELSSRNIRYDDMLRSWSRKSMSSPSDSDLCDIVLNMALLEDVWQREDKPILWFTNSDTFNKPGIPVCKRNGRNGQAGEVSISSAKAYNLFLRAWQMLGASLAVRDEPGDAWLSINARNATHLKSFNYKTYHELQVSFPENSEFAGQRFYPVLTGPSPSGQASIQLSSNAVYQAWLRGFDTPPTTPTSAFRTDVYNGFLDLIAHHPATR